MDALSSALTQLNRDHGPSNVLCLAQCDRYMCRGYHDALRRATTALAQGRCIRAYGTSACNADPIKPVFERTGWRTTGLDHITFRVAEPQKEAAFYAALMGWRMRSNEGARSVMDVGNWGTVIFRQVPSESSRQCKRMTLLHSALRCERLLKATVSRSSRGTPRVSNRNSESAD